MKFSDGVKIDTNISLRPLYLSDGWYVVGEGMLVPVKDKKEALEVIEEITRGRQRVKSN